jgi:hypothetical protein
LRAKDPGLAFKQTSYTNTAMTSVQNQVEDVHIGYGQLSQQYQATGDARGRRRTGDEERLACEGGLGWAVGGHPAAIAAVWG